MGKWRAEPQGGKRYALLSGVLLGAWGMSADGGNSSSTPPFRDFAITLSPASLTEIVGTVSQPIAVTISAKNGFADTVNVTMQSTSVGTVMTPTDGDSAFGNHERTGMASGYRPTWFWDGLFCHGRRRARLARQNLKAQV